MDEKISGRNIFEINETWWRQGNKKRSLEEEKKSFEGTVQCLAYLRKHRRKLFEILQKVAKQQFCLKEDIFLPEVSVFFWPGNVARKAQKALKWKM